MKGKDALAISTNFCYVLADLMETNLMDLESIFKKNNIALRHEQKRYYNAAITNTKKLCREVNHCNDKVQEHYGNDADMLNAIILTLIDRCGNEDILMWKFYEYVKSFPSQFQMVDDMDWAFSHIFEKKKDESK
ncbi:MAG: hypothetical protein IJE78_00310 [Bacteroidaceae bacterium]|nr:hypothetical protein [Bacteroidaceae bacterium]